jgi:hypothetical protein
VEQIALRGSRLLAPASMELFLRPKVEPELMVELLVLELQA